MSLILLLLALPHAGDRAGLGSPDWPTRDRSEKALLRTGWRALPAVLPGLSDPDPEVRDRCRRVWANVVRDPAEMCVSGRGWCDDRTAQVWGQTPGAWRRLEAAGQSLGLLPFGCRGPWVGNAETQSPQAVKAYVNYCRSQYTGRPLPWSVPWSECANAGGRGE